MAHRFGLARRAAVLASLALLSPGCGSEPAVEAPQRAETAAEVPAEARAPEAAASASASPNRPPRVANLAISPASPRSGDIVRAVVKASDPDGDAVELGYLWRVAGRTVPGAGPSIELEGARKGSLVELRVTASDGRAESDTQLASAEVQNSPPQLSGLDLEPTSEWHAGGAVMVHPQAKDADGDDLEFEYQWRVNDRTIDEASAILSTEGLRRGDRIEVRVTASDGEAESDSLTSDSRRLVNAPPQVQTLPEETHEQGVFRYRVVAEDPDGDRSLSYRLVKAPEGMTIDVREGQIEWRPSEEQTGTHRVTVQVDDRKGGVAEQVFNVYIDLDETQPPAEPAGAEESEEL